MARMLGKTAHGVFCDCVHSKQNTPADKCHKKHGTTRKRSRERRQWMKDVVSCRVR